MLILSPNPKYGFMSYFSIYFPITERNKRDKKSTCVLFAAIDLVGNCDNAVKVKCALRNLQARSKPKRNAKKRYRLRDAIVISPNSEISQVTLACDEENSPRRQFTPGHNLCYHFPSPSLSVHTPHVKTSTT